MCTKVHFTKFAAEQALKAATRSHSHYRKERRMYYCNECSCWHLTSQQKDEGKPKDVFLKHYKAFKKFM